MASPVSRSEAGGRLYLQFRLGADRYALDVHDIVEVLPLRRFKQLPEAPAWVAGLYVHRGELLPVLDLSQIACGRPAPRLTSTRLVLVDYRFAGDGPQRRLGLILEQASQTLRRDPAAFRDYGVERGEARYLGPVLEDAEGLLQRVDVSELLPETVRELLLAGGAEHG
ncbi:chemotaxis protein CheW [Pseudomonas citronellolis]|uniref:chemotaxis protein CheW n=1 Tax=Pseudomonas citronellolis TaxID=53408 RepID=UPI0023E3F26C|nr:chemotaxis protein CheW [Pseudomonas citronellolis]MDF3936398.1 chemotaxis protein CheW [Pseudomonas citronellolis]